ncbi:MAG: glycosyltransferase family 4 protein [Smithellaceae bacterium]|nr:glycosyltransferase family 4 protein [Smithellaceae bacterium]
MGKIKFRTILANIPKYLSMIRIIRDTKPDLVLIPISQTTRGFLKDSVYIFVSRLFSRRILLQLRGSNFKDWFNGTSVMTRLYIRQVLRLAEGIIVLGEKIKPQFYDFFDRDRIFVVPNGADYQIPPRDEISDRLRLLYLSNLQPSKGIDDIMQALLILKEKGHDGLELDVAGTWRSKNHQESTIEMVTRHALPVTFHATVVGRDKFDLLSRSDVFVFTPREPEGHPWVIIEAMAAGLPIISTDQGAITESVIDGDNGFIVDAKSPEQIADKILYLLEHPVQRQQMGQASRRRYLNDFTEKSMVERLRQTFSKVIEPAS